MVDNAAAKSHFAGVILAHLRAPDPQEGLREERPGFGRRLTPRARTGLAMTLFFWGSNYLLLTLGTALAGNPRLGAIAEVRILTTIVGLGFCYLIHLLLKHPRLRSTRRRLFALAIVAPVAAECFAWTAYFAEAAVDPAVSAQPFTWSGAIRSVSFWTWVFLAWSGLYLALTYSFDVRDQQQHAARLQEEVHTAQLQALHSQINPHFLFNSLNSVSALILDGKPELAENMVTKLAQFLRLNLAADPRSKIPLASEIALQKSYLDIERVRYPDLVVDIDVPDQLASALVPSLMLQPIIENAVKYGVAGAPPPASVRIAASDGGDRLRLEVVDAGKGGAAVAGAGIGLRNIRRRLELIYGASRVSLTAGAVSGVGFMVEVVIPLERR